MLHKCANPGCHNEFRKLTQGKLFVVETSDMPASVSSVPRKDRTRRMEHYWLCDQCTPLFTLAYERGRGIVTVPLELRPAKMSPSPERNDDLTTQGRPYPDYGFARRA